ncbi:hypothetical protein F5X96DRAFT_603458 [Biscogniauxia mediterranea]|nr:hypothetical protein F5X96DRAFT_603458 [Biscogniauxia mediterranea]
MSGNHRHRGARTSSSVSASVSPRITRHSGRHARKPTGSDTVPVDSHVDSKRNDPNSGYSVAVDGLHIASLAPQSLQNDSGSASYSTASYSSHDTPQYYPNIDDDLYDGEAHSQLQAPEPHYTTHVQYTISTMQTNMYPDQTPDNVGWTAAHDSIHDDGSTIYQSTRIEEPLAYRPDPDNVPMTRATTQEIMNQAEPPDWNHAAQYQSWSTRVEYGSVMETDDRSSAASETAPQKESVRGTYDGDSSAGLSEEHEHPLYRYLHDDQAPFVGIERQHP